MSEQRIYIQGTLLSEETHCTLAELCLRCGVDAAMIEAMVEEGIITPADSTASEGCFTALAIKRVQTAMRLHRDLRVNLPGCALALDLLDELEELRRLVRRL